MSQHPSLQDRGPRSTLSASALMFLFLLTWSLDRNDDVTTSVHDRLYLLSGYSVTMHYLDGTRMELMIDRWLSYGLWSLSLYILPDHRSCAGRCPWVDVSLFYRVSCWCSLHFYLAFPVGLALCESWKSGVWLLLLFLCRTFCLSIDQLQKSPCHTLCLCWESCTGWGFPE